MISTNFRHANHLRYHVRYSSEFHYNNVVTLYISTMLELLNSLNNLFYFILNICCLNILSWISVHSYEHFHNIIEYFWYIINKKINSLGNYCVDNIISKFLNNLRYIVIITLKKIFNWIKNRRGRKLINLLDF